jgi:hypothetical protein
VSTVGIEAILDAAEVILLGGFVEAHAPTFSHHRKLGVTGVTGVTPRDFGVTKGFWLRLAVPRLA